MRVCGSFSLSLLVVVCVFVEFCWRFAGSFVCVWVPVVFLFAPLMGEF